MFIIRLTEKSIDRHTIKGDEAYNLGFIIGKALGEGILILVIAVFLLIIARLINDGYKLKNENDLTI